MSPNELIRDLARLADEALEHDPDTAAVLGVLVRTLTAGESTARVAHLAIEIEERARKARLLSA
jgi:hypothetical protein